MTFFFWVLFGVKATYAFHILRMKNVILYLKNERDFYAFISTPGLLQNMLNTYKILEQICNGLLNEMYDYVRYFLYFSFTLIYIERIPKFIFAVILKSSGVQLYVRCRLRYFAFLKMSG